MQVAGFATGSLEIPLQAGAVERPNLPIPRSMPPLDVGGGGDRQQERGAFPASPSPAPRFNILLIKSIQEYFIFYKWHF
jgi:hypothetical protein